MSKIKVMDENLANKISAGEVVEKTMNVVKELVENSIDANSNEISIELIESGVKEITVKDNGVGMDRSDATLAFSRHATSKLKTIDDLFTIESLGFRGEALPSIAAVSNVELKTSDGKIGTYVSLSGGKNLQIENSSLQQGTTIKVKDLFYNTPVRLKYLKNLYIELANIVEYVDKMSLAHPDISFKLVNNSKLLLNTDGSNNLLKVIYAIYGIDISKKMVEISGENDDYYISGYISYPECSKSNRNAITTIVNGRIIKNNELNRAIIDCYHTYIPKDRFPIVVLNIDVDPVLIDINIHPTKMDIKFSKFKELKELIENLITNKLKKLFLIPNVSVRDNDSINEVRNQINEVNVNTQQNNYTYEKLPIPYEETTRDYEEVSFDFSVGEIKEESYNNENIDTNNSNEDKPQNEIKRIRKIKPMYPKGIVYETYIIAENEDGMFIIDQHAAAERINYEKVLESLKKKGPVIDLLIPIKIELSSNEFLIVKENFDLLRDLGFNAEEFGINTIIIRSHPSWIKEDIAEECIRKVVEIVSVKEEFDFDKFVWRMAATMACRMSIKAHDFINFEDQEYLLNELSYCNNPFTCPHGRPTIITYTKYDLEKLFKRVME